MPIGVLALNDYYINTLSNRFSDVGYAINTSYALRSISKADTCKPPLSNAFEIILFLPSKYSLPMLPDEVYSIQHYAKHFVSFLHQ